MCIRFSLRIIHFFVVIIYRVCRIRWIFDNLFVANLFIVTKIFLFLYFFMLFVLLWGCRSLNNWFFTLFGLRTMPTAWLILWVWLLGQTTYQATSTARETMESRSTVEARQWRGQTRKDQRFRRNQLLAQDESRWSSRWAPEMWAWMTRRSPSTQLPCSWFIVIARFFLGN